MQKKKLLTDIGRHYLIRIIINEIQFFNKSVGIINLH